MKPCLPCALLVACSTSFAAVPQWPQFRGPNASGVAEGDKPPVEFGPGTNELWKIEVPAGLSSPCVWGDRIFLTAAADGKMLTLAVNRGDGKILWRQGVTADTPKEIHKKNHPAAATPATDGKSVCVYHATFGLAAYDFDGRELWRKPMPGLLARNGSGTSPAMVDGRLVLNCDVEEGKSFIAAFEPATGKEYWRTPRAEYMSGYSTPVGWLQEGRDEIPKEFIEQGMFSGIDRNQDGFLTQKEWDEATAFLDQADYGIFALKPSGPGELTTNHVAWKHKKGVASVSSPLFYRGRIYVAQDGGRVSCFNAKSGGKFFEQERLGAEGEYYASPIAANGYVYFSSGKGAVTVLEAGDTFRIKGPNLIGEPIHATPAIVDDKLYVRTAERLWAFGSK